ncbi:MAG: ATP-dependent helicase [Anaerolineae bacterium]|jgi:DNA helicase-2/ATP-dependent DNA helicase PcrA|nr:MAG: ATP-dependent helicase [Anaerolineae bacterium]
MNIQLRPAQLEVTAYRSGKMGVLAVPGSGKTLTLAYLAAELLTHTTLQRGQEILIVTLVNSAVDVFTQRIRALLEQRGLLPLNFRVRTLHGLAHDILRERPEVVGLDERFVILDEAECNRILESAVKSWLHQHGDQLLDYLDEALTPAEMRKIQRKDLPELVQEIASAFIRFAKDHRMPPGQLRTKLDQLPFPLPLLEMGASIYADYQRSLTYRGAVDFDDLVRLAYDALQWDTQLLERLRQRWPYILEDEAQDSSWTQEQILRVLVGESGNWVRVGDPNQAIYETFTTANPKYLRHFVHEAGVIQRHLPNSGRSTLSIMELANQLVRWTMTQHPIQAVRDGLQGPPFITPVPADDPHPNPPDDPAQIHLHPKKQTVEEEIKTIVHSLKRWLPAHPDWTVAVLAPTHDLAIKVVEALKKENLPFEDSLLRSSASTRRTAQRLRDILQALADPLSANKLATAYVAWRLEDYEDPLLRSQVISDKTLLQRCAQVETYLYPTYAEDWLAEICPPQGEESPAIPLAQQETYYRLARFRQQMHRWLDAILLPIDQLVLTLQGDLFAEPAELALSHKLALMLRQASDANPQWRLHNLAQELAVIAENERRFLGFSRDDNGFDPQAYAGRVVVCTAHKAKGLEWDRVYLISVNNYDYPSGAPYDTYKPERWFVRGRLNLQAEALAQFEWLIAPNETAFPQEGQATLQARLDYVRERLRLLYVGITRARRELVITSNTGRRGDKQPALAFVVLSEYWKKVHAQPAT